MPMSSPDRSKRLHNFTLPCLKWGHQRFLRCVKLQQSSSLSPDRSVADGFQSRPINLGTSQNSQASSRFNIHKESDANIQADERKVAFDLRLAAKKVKISYLGGEEGRDENVPVRPWNLRTRRAACNDPREGKNLDSPGRNESVTVMVKGNSEKNEKVKFSLPLRKEEIEEDFVAMTGKRPPKRPKKRPKIMQKQLNSLLPGLWLTEVTPDSYKVPDIPES